MKKLELSMLLALVFVLAVSMLALERECDGVRESVLRLHVLANSDSSEDQALKLRVRDRLLKESARLFSGAQNREQAIEAAREHAPELRRAAVEEIRAAGFGYDVTVEIGECSFDTREYEQVTLPAGVYEAVNVRIGEAEGKNWWCVMFPQMCLPAACESEELEDVLSERQLELVTGDYTVRFKCIEIIERLKERLG